MTTKKWATRYSEEFKQSIVSLSQTGRSANSLAKEYGVSVSTVSKWINQADPTNDKVLSKNERDLIKENKRLKEELDILKRAAVLLAKNWPIEEDRSYWASSIAIYLLDTALLVFSLSWALQPLLTIIT